MDRRNSPSKIPVRTSGKYRENVRTCAQVRLISPSPPHRHCKPPSLRGSASPPRIRRLVDCFVDWRQRRQRRRRRRRRCRGILNPSPDDWDSDSEERSCTSAPFRDTLFRVIARPPLGKPEVRGSSVYIGQFSVIVLLLLTSVFHIVAISVIGDLKRYLTSEKDFRSDHGDLHSCVTWRMWRKRVVAWLIQGKRYVYICSRFIASHFLFIYLLILNLILYMIKFLSIFLDCIFAKGELK